MKIFTIQSQFLGEFTAKSKYSYSQEYSPQCESSISEQDYKEYGYPTHDVLGYVFDDSSRCFENYVNILSCPYVIHKSTMHIFVRTTNLHLCKSCHRYVYSVGRRRVLGHVCPETLAWPRLILTWYVSTAKITTYEL